MKVLHLDFETASCISLRDQGLDRYSKDKSTRVLMMAWAFDNDPVQLWEPRIGQIPKRVARAIKDGVTVAAWNAGFERNIFGHVLGIHIPYEQWVDPSTYARYLSLPGSLQSVSDILGLGNEGKDKEGKRLIDLFCKPMSMGGEITLFGVTDPYFADPEKHQKDWESFKSYCIQDVRAERKVMNVLEDLGCKLTRLEKDVWYLDQKINDAGLPVNRTFVKKALALAERSKEELSNTLKEKTGLANPNSRDQMLEWCRTQGYVHNSMDKNAVAAALNGSKITQVCREVLLCRKEAAKTSYTKLDAILNMTGDDDRLRNQFLYLGAARSGRWSGSGVQFQNMARPTKEVEKNLEKVIGQIEAEDYGALKADHPSVITAVTSCIRSSFQASEGKKLVVCDLNAIENRVLGWMANCDAILKVFRDGRCPYMDFAAKLYNCRYEDLADTSVTPHKPKNKEAAERRQIAKPAVLGCGYGLGPGVEKKCKACGHRFGYRMYCQNKKCRSDEYEFEIVWVENRYGDKVKTGLLGYAESMGVKLTPAQAYRAQSTFRKMYPEVVQLWKDLEEGAKRVLKEGGEIQVGVLKFDRLELNGQFILRMILPSGRALHYVNAKIKIRYSVGRDGEPYERESIEYDGIGHGIGSASKEEGGQGNNWGPVWTAGPKLCENGDQAISRDVMAHGLLLADEQGAEILGHTHDEGIVLSDDDPLSFCLADLKECMEARPSWAGSLPLGADGYEDKYYRKN